ncbi:MAG: 5-formyltetrahydrofolate cyclo-ligase [Propionibacteriaceae bacterium]
MTNEADDIALSEAKRLLRQAVLIRRKARPTATRTAADTARTEVVKNALIAGDRPTTVAVYLSADTEPATLELVAWLASVRVRVLLPVLGPHVVDGRPGEPDWAPYAGTDRLRDAPFGLIEPDTDPLGAGALRDVQVVVVPALAATSGGDRLGRGGGWYDRALLHTHARTKTWALLNDDEVMEVVPAQGWDVPVHVLATPTQLLTCS